MGVDRDDASFRVGRRRNAALGWPLVVALCFLAAVHAVQANYRWFTFAAFAVVVMLVPAITRRNPLVLPPWTILALVAIPVIDVAIFSQPVLTPIAVYVAVAAIALVIVLEIHRLTAVRLTHTFAIVLVVITTLAIAAGWNVAQWIADMLFGTAYLATGRSEDAANHAMMMDFVYAAVAGILAGFVFDRYLFEYTAWATETDNDEAEDERAAPSADRTSTDTSASGPPLIRGRFDVPGRTARRLSRTLQAALVVVCVYGVVTLDVTTITNAGIALAITTVPRFIERKQQLSLEPELVLWLTGAVFLHAVGSAGLYDLLGPWDSLTHAVSASIVAGGGYAVVRAVDLYSEEVYFPPRMLFVFILLFVLAFGVIWELMEFGLDLLGEWIGSETILAQHGITDTIGDLFYDLVGAFVVAVWGTVYLTDVAHRIAHRFHG